MPFHRFMQVGRVVLINFGPDKDKLAVVVDIVDQNKCLVDGGTLGKRKMVSYARIAMTDFVIEIERNAQFEDVSKAWEDADITAKWEATSWAKKISNKVKRANLNDFDRFKVMVAKKQKAEIIRKKMASM